MSIWNLLRAVVRLGLAAAAALVGQHDTPHTWTGEPIRVELTDGRTLLARVDARTEETVLWLRSGTEKAAIVQPIAWEQVQRVALPGAPQGESVEPALFRQQVLQWRARQQASAADPQPQLRVIRSPLAHRPLTTGREEYTPTGHDAAAPEALATAEPDRICWVEVTAEPSNWDADVSADGLLLQLRPMTSRQTAAAVRGLIEVKLIGYRVHLLGGAKPPETIDRWTVPVQSGHFDGYAYTFRLPYRRGFPEADTRWAPYGAVHVRLSVPGQGVFEATDSMLRIRAASPLRDRLETSTGRRFASWEHVAAAPD